MKRSRFREILKEEIDSFLKMNEEIEDSKLYLYHRTKITYFEKLKNSKFILNKNKGRLGEGIYLTYDDPKTINHSKMEQYGNLTLQYSISLSDLNTFLIFDKNISNKPLINQLNPIKGEVTKLLINNFEDILKNGYYISSSKEKLLLKLYKNLPNKNDILIEYIKIVESNPKYSFILLDTITDHSPDLLSSNYDGILYDASSGSSMGKSTGTSQTAVIYNPSILKFETLSTDGFNFTQPSEKINISSIESDLVKGLIPDNYTINKSYIKLNNKKKVHLPKNLKIIGSIDLRNIQDLYIPDDLEVTNSIYISKGTYIPDTVKASSIKEY